MDVASVAAAVMSAQTGRVQLAVAAKMLKMSADSDKAVLALLDAVQASGDQLANAAAGLGQNLDISV
jgi:hypothetical protein